MYAKFPEKRIFCTPLYANVSFSKNFAYVPNQWSQRWQISQWSQRWRFLCALHFHLEHFQAKVYVGIHFQRFQRRLPSKKYFKKLSQNYFSVFRKKHSLREKCPNTGLFLVRIFLFSVRIQENKDQK